MPDDSREIGTLVPDEFLGLDEDVYSQTLYSKEAVV